MPSGNTSLCLKRHARGIASRHMAHAQVIFLQVLTVAECSSCKPHTCAKMESSLHSKELLRINLYLMHRLRKAVHNPPFGRARPYGAGPVRFVST